MNGCPAIKNDRGCLYIEPIIVIEDRTVTGMRTVLAKIAVHPNMHVLKKGNMANECREKAAMNWHIHGTIRFLKIQTNGSQSSFDAKSI